jgi:hypothetical protein
MLRPCVDGSSQMAGSISICLYDTLNCSVFYGMCIQNTKGSTG